MASMDETGILLQFMSKLIAMETQREIADELLELLRRYRLDGVVQTRAGDQALTVSAAGVDLPLEVAIIEHVRKQGTNLRIQKPLRAQLRAHHADDQQPAA